MSTQGTGKRVLVIVDMQRDFVDGSLGTKKAQEVVARVAQKAETWDGVLIFTRDTHDAGYLDSAEGRKLPVIHCQKGTPGWEIVPELEEIRKTKEAVVVDKPTFGSFALVDAVRAVERAEGLAAIELVGLCTDICVVSNAILLKTAFPEVPITVDAACTEGVTTARRDAALQVMDACHIEIAGTASGVEV